MSKEKILSEKSNAVSIARNTYAIGWWLCVAVLAVSSFLFLFRLGNGAFWDTDESVYAEVMREAEVSGDYLTPKFRGENFFDKPPLYYWEGLLASKIFPGPEFAYRFPSALAGILSVLATMLIAFEATGSIWTAASAGIILTLFPAFLEAGRQVKLDVPVTLPILLAFYFFLRGLRNPRWYLGVGAFIGLGVMTKSVVGLFALPAIVFYALFFRNFSWLKSAYVWCGAILGVLIVLPWHVYETYLFGSQFWNEYFFHLVVNRFAADIVNGSSASVGGFLTYILQYGAPWSILLIPLTAVLIFSKNEDRDDPFKKSSYVFACAALSIIIVFSVSTTKVIYYSVPSFSFIALSLALTGSILYRKQNMAMFFALLAPLILCAALIYTIMAGFHTYGAFAALNTLARDEKKAGLVLAANPYPEKVYEYNFGLWGTIFYYSGGRKVYLMQEDQVLNEPFFLILPTEFYRQKPFPEELASRFTTRYSGPSLTLVSFVP